jgi:uncharacterized protein (DUF1684 family)
MRLALVLAAGSLFAATVSTSYLAELAKWRTEREASLKKPDGWLSVSGLFWLHEGANMVGSDPKADVVTPAGTPERAGLLRFAGGKTIFEPQTGAGALIGDKPARRMELKADVTNHPDVIKIGDVTLTLIVRGPKTGVRMRDPNADTRRNFTGNVWYPADPAWRVVAKWVKYSQPKQIRITNILGMTDDEPSPGYAEFAVKGKMLRLEPVLEDGGLSFYFKDTTSGRTTYPPGRFLDADVPRGSEIVLDFNEAYNPPCAFTAYATCPLPPKQNVLAAPIEAGEKNYGHHE